MNRREFSLQLAGAAGAAALCSLGLPGRAMASPGAPQIDAPSSEPIVTIFGANPHRLHTDSIGW